MAKLSQKKQNELITEEIDKINENLTDVSPEKLKSAQRLVERIAFMTITLQVLEDDIKKNGPTYQMEQGSQKMMVENPAQKSYNTMINRYTAAYSKLLDLLPKEQPKEQEDGFDEFLMKR